MTQTILSIGKTYSINLTPYMIGAEKGLEEGYICILTNSPESQMSSIGCWCNAGEWLPYRDLHIHHLTPCDTSRS